MQGDVKNTTKLLQYPRMETFDSIDKESLVLIISENIDFRKKYMDDLSYYIGKNVAINRTKNDDQDNPDSRISVPYSRSMTQIVKGYMYKPGLITYDSKNKGYMDKLQDVFDQNNEELKTSELGEAQAKYGLGVELLYSDNGEKGAIPKFTNVKPEECIFIFNMEIEPTLIGTIRYYIIKEDKTKSTRTYRVEVYFTDRIEIYEMVEKGFTQNKEKEIDIKGKLEITQQLNEFPNFYGEIPFVLYRNNQEYHADYQPVKTLVDAYDILMSDSVNELNRFASAYLLLKNFILANADDEAQKKHELEKMKTRRVIELFEDGNVEFLTKEIPDGFINSLKQALREDIEYHSHIPDFRGKSFEAKSGVAQEWSLFDFENLCGDKQAQFEQGLQRRIQLINNFFGIMGTETDKVNIKFERNKPVSKTEKINNIVLLKSSGLVPDQILLEKLKELEIVDDVDEAMGLMEEQKKKNMEMMPMDIDEETPEENEENA